MSPPITMTFEEARAKIEPLKIKGWGSVRELKELFEVARSCSVGAELGSYHGLSAAYCGLAGCSYYAVDNWTEFPKAERIFELNMASLELNNVAKVKGDVLDPATVARVPEVDFLYVDADHSHEGVKGCIKLWLPKVKEIILFHDYGDPVWTGVQPAVDEAVQEGKLKLLRVVDRLAVCFPAQSNP